MGDNRPPVRLSAPPATALLASTAALFASSCGHAGPGDVAYCVDQSNRVVEPRYCDSGYHGGGLFFFSYGRFGYGRPYGYVLPGGGQRVDPRDGAARSRIGLPATGTVTSSKGGGFGTTTHSTGSGSGAKSGATAGHGSAGS
jgi:hypothetical protein